MFEHVPAGKVSAKNKKVIRKALKKCFFENDIEGFLEILEPFYEGQSKIVREVFRKGANPSFQKVMELAHAAVA